MIAALTSDEPGAAGLAAHPLIGNRHLQRGLYRFRSGVGVETVIHAVRRDIDQPVGQFKRLGMAHLEGRRIIQLRHLILHCLDDFRPRMAGIHTPQPGGAVQHLAAIGGVVMHVLGTDEHARTRLEMAVRRKRHPEGT